MSTAEAKKKAGAESAALAKKAPSTPLAAWKDAVFMPENLATLGRALNGTGYNPERFAHAAYMVVARNNTIQRNLGESDPKALARYKQNLWLGVYAAAECGLSLQPHMQQIHLVPYGKEIQPIIGYQGHTYLVSKAGHGLMGPPVYVFQRDIDEGRFHYREGSREVCELDPVVRNPEAPRGILRYAFVIFTSSSGVVKFKCMERDAFLERREKSAGWRAFKSGQKKTSPWNIDVVKEGPQAGSETGDWLSMCGKTVIRDFAKVLPKSTDHWGERAAKAEAVDDVTEVGVSSLAEILDTAVEERAEETANEALRRELGSEDAETEGGA